MHSSQVVDLTTICNSFPDMPNPLISHDNILSTFDTIFTGDTQLLIVEGEEGVGKTTLLAQFSIKHHFNAFSLFIKPTSKWAYDPESLRFDLCNQIQWILCGSTLNTAEGVDDTFLRRSWGSLQAYAKQRKMKFFFIVDGLDEIPQEESQISKIIIEMLPFGLSSFRFLFAGEPSQILANVNSKVPHKTHVLSGFTLDETNIYLNDLSIEKEIAEEIYKLCRGIPGYLASVRRILDSDFDVHDVLDVKPDKLSRLFEVEWRKVNVDDGVQQRLLSVIAYARKGYTIDDLCRILNIDNQQFDRLTQDLKFITINSQNHEVSFVSEAFRKFVVHRLRHLKDSAHDLVINDLFKLPEGDDALIYLPSYLDRAGRFDDLVDYLSLDHCTKMVERSQSLVPAQQKTELGVKAALEVHRDGDLMRFGVQGALLAEIGGSEVWKSEIEARMTLNDYDAALTLAQSNVLKEDRLHLLAIIGRTMREQGLALNEDLVDQIRQLYEQIDRNALGSRAVEIASELIYSIPDLAIKLVEEATKTDLDDNALDWAFARLSLATLEAKRAPLQAKDTIEDIYSRIKDPKALRVSATASLLLGEYSATEVIAKTDKFERVGDRLYMLRLWTLENSERTDAVEVVDFALELIIQTTTYAPNAKVFREIAAPLPFVQSQEQLGRLVASFDSQRGTLERLGPTQDYVRFQLLLAQAEAKYNIAASCARVIDTYFYVDEIDDLTVKSECLAWLVDSITTMDHDMFFEKKEGIHTLAQEDLQRHVTNLLGATADHYQVTKGIVKALAKTKPDLAISIIQLLNTQARRDAALFNLIKTNMLSNGDLVDLSFVQRVIKDLADSDLRDEVILNVMVHLSNIGERGNELVTRALPLIDRIKDIEDALQRCLACCYAYTFLTKWGANQHPSLSQSLLSQLEIAWSAIDVEWHRIDTGFRISKILAECALEESKRFLKLTEQFRDDVMLDSSTVALAYMHCIRLAMRTYSGLLPKRIDSDEDIQSLARLIDNILSNGERADLWTELALRCYINKRSDTGNRIVMQYIKPLLQGLSDKDLSYRNITIVIAAPALYTAHKGTAIELFQRLSQDDKNQVCDSICKFILRKQVPADSYDALPGQGYDVSFEDFVDICELLDLTDSDGDIYHFITCISSSIVSRRYKDHFTSLQKVDIANRLTRIIDSKLPSPRFIQHAGFKIAAKAQIARFQQSNPPLWTSLIDEARLIANIADRALVLTMIAEAMPSKEAPKRKSLLTEAKEIIKRIPAAFDRIEHYEALVASAADVEPAMYKEFLKLAMKSAVDSDNPEVHPIQRRLIDLAHGLDSEFAASLASLADEDPARLKGRLQVLDLKKKIANQFATTKNLAADESGSDYSEAAWMLLGALNAGSIAEVNIAHLRDYIQVASRLPFHQSYSILAWILENIVRSYARTDEARRFIRPVYDALLLEIELVKRMAGRSLKQLNQTQRHLAESSSKDSILIRPGEREAAIEFIKNWFINKVHNYLKISDEYFGPEDLEILQLLRSVKPDCKVQILTSKKHQDNEKVALPWEDAYCTYWRVHISSIQNPPGADITIIGTVLSGESPMHDRWWITEGSGIRIGTSFNGLGKSTLRFLFYHQKRLKSAKVKSTGVYRVLKRNIKAKDYCVGPFPYIKCRGSGVAPISLSAAFEGKVLSNVHLFPRVFLFLYSITVKILSIASWSIIP